MSEFLMEFYNAQSGVQFTLQWKDENEFLQGKAFLKQLLGDGFGPSTLELDKPPFYYLENDELFDALLEFRRELRNSQR